MASRTRNYLAGLLSGYTVTFVTVAVGLWLTPFTLRFLDREEYAIFALTGDILMWLNLLDLGITASFRVKVAQLTGRPDAYNINRLASTAFFSQTGVVFLVALIGGAFVYTFPTFFKVRPDLQTQAMQLVGLLMVGVIINMATQTFSALLVAHQQIHIDNLIRLALIAIRTGLTVVLLLGGLKLLSLAVANVTAISITTSLAVLRCYKMLPDLTIRYRLASWDQLKSLGNLGIWFSLGGLAGIFIESLDRVVAARLLSLESVTTLALTSRVYLLAYGVLGQITNIARPALGQLFGEGKLIQALNSYRNIFIISNGLAISLAFSLFAANGWFVVWWVGSENYGGWWLDLALGLNLIINCWVLPNRATLSAALIVRPQTISRVIEGILNLSLAIILGRYFGLPGIVFSTALAGILTSCWYLPRLTAALFQRNYLKFIWQEGKKFLICGILIALIALYLKSLMLSSHYLINAGLVFFINFLLATILVFILACDTAFRSQIRHSLYSLYTNYHQKLAVL
ncbi:MAG: hypothetical protein PHW74_15200 [Desulfobacca sp.]|nr:hypothetical protein [Desulfobacca sp.]